MTNISKKSGKSKGALSKSRYFCFLLYPDSAPENFVDCLSSLGQPMAISPRHDLDIAEVNKDTGEVVYKKPHWHAIYVANNNVTADSVRKKLQRALGQQAVSMVKICDNVGNYYKYLTHESDDAIAKGKHVYDKEAIISLNNFDVSRYTDLSKEAKEDKLNDICDLIRIYELTNIVQLMTYVEHHHACGVTKKEVMDTAQAYSSILRLFFDGVYQERGNNRK